MRHLEITQIEMIGYCFENAGNPETTASMNLFFYENYFEPFWNQSKLK